MSGISENMSVQIRKKRGNKIPIWYDACDPWNFVVEMALRKKTLRMTRSGNQHADREVSRAKSRLDSLHHEQMPRTSWPHVPSASAVPITLQARLKELSY